MRQRDQELWMAVLVMLAMLVPASSARCSHEVERTRLGRLPKNLLGLVADQDGHHVAAHACEETLGFGSPSRGVWIDGKFGPKVYGQLSTPMFAPHGGRWAAVACKKGPWLVVSDWTEGPPFEQLAYLLRFTPDGEHLLYAGMREGKWRVVVDGQEGAPYDAVLGAAFSPNGERVACVVVKEADSVSEVPRWNKQIRFDKKSRTIHFPDFDFAAFTGARGLVSFRGHLVEGGRQCLVLDGNEGDEFDAIATASVTFSPDSQRLAYAAERDGKWCVVVDGEPGPVYDALLPESLIFSPDSESLAYVATREGRFVVVVDQEEGEVWDEILDGTPIFSKDEHHWAYGALEGDEWRMVLDGVEGSPYDGIVPGSPVFRPNSARLAYCAQQGEDVVVVVDDQPGPRYDAVLAGTPQFAPDGKQLVYGAQRDGEWVLVSDGAPQGGYEELLAGRAIRERDVAPDHLRADPHSWLLRAPIAGPIAFSPDATRVAFGAKQEGRWSVVVDGARLADAAELYPGSITFGPDSKHVAYLAQTGKRAFNVCLDGEIVGGPVLAPPQFSPDGTLQFVEVEGAGIEWRRTSTGVAGALVPGVALGMLFIDAFKDRDVYHVIVRPGG